jgi:predicted phage tail protein
MNTHEFFQCQEELTTIRLYGRLGRLFGRRLRLSVRSAAEAVVAIDILKPGFRRTLRDMNGYAFSVKRGGVDVTNGYELLMPLNGAVLEITPVVMGAANKGIFSAILGVVLIVVGAILWETGIGLYLVGMGASMLLSGIASLLAGKQNTQVKGKNTASYEFGGAVNTTQQSLPVPVCYGHVITGSAVASAGIRAMEYNAAQQLTGGNTGSSVPPGWVPGTGGGGGGAQPGYGLWQLA